VPGASGKLSPDAGHIEVTRARVSNKELCFMSQQHFVLERDRRRYLFLVPGLVVYLLIIVVPTLYSAWLSFFKWDGIQTEKIFVGLKNYVELFTTDYAFPIALRNNILWILLTLVFTVCIALLLALLINRKFTGRTAVRGVLYFPYVLSGSLVGVVWIWVYHYQLGLYTGVMEMLGLLSFKKAWLSDPNTAIFACYLADFWRGVGQPMMLFLAGLQMIPQDILEAANIDGANPRQRFFHVTLPQLRETMVIVLATQIINSLKVYDLIRTMTGGGPANSTETLATWMVTKSFDLMNFGGGSAVAMIMVFISMIIIVPYVLLVSRE
jgi:raffinose/stachyose/melibiose transport system permease protein